MQHFKRVSALKVCFSVAARQGVMQLAGGCDTSVRWRPGVCFFSTRVLKTPMQLAEGLGVKGTRERARELVPLSSVSRPQGRTGLSIWWL